MNPTNTISYGLAQARIADLHDQARHQSLIRAARVQRAQSNPQHRGSRISGHLHLRHRITPAVS